MRKIKLSLGLLLMCLFAFVFSSIFVYADANGMDTSIDSVDLYNETNTYNYILNTTNTSSYDFNNDARYDLNDRNANMVENEGPAITVFTHGWNGHASTFLDSNKDTKNASLVKEFIDKICDSNIFIAKYNETNNDYEINREVLLYDITKEYKDNGTYSGSIIPEINDISKHIVIIFDGYNTFDGHDYIYTQFNYMMSNILYQYKKLKNNLLPKVNLIGHSRGGLTNMQYALDHPDIVASLTSFGTPYLGTSTAELATIYADSLVTDWALENFQNGFINNGMKDLGSYNVYSKYYNRWNDNYEKLYSHINCLALGGVSTFDFLLDMTNILPILANVGITYASLRLVFGPAVDIVLGKIVEYAGSIIAGALTISVLIELVDEWLIEQLPDSGDFAVEAIKDLKTIVVGLVKLIVTEFKPNIFNSDPGAWMSDGAVNIESQMASRVIDDELHEYKGFSRHYEYFYSEDGTSEIVHCVEMTHPDLQKYALLNLTPKVNEWSVSLLENNTLEIYGYNGVWEEDENGFEILKEIPEELTIPEKLEHNGVTYTVTKISESAFANDFYNKKIKKVIIPSTIKEIGDKAFYNCESLKEVDLSSATSLVRIGDEAFAQNPNLGNLTLPSNLQSIGRKAFAGNLCMTSINIPSSVNIIEEGTFAASNISSISNYSSAYIWTNNLLINKNVSDSSRLEVIYVNPNATFITIPNNVKSISAYAFAGNLNITTIDLNQVEVIGTDAFINSNITNIIGNNVNTADVLSFANTPWLEAQEDNCIVLGNTLLKYITSDNTVIIEEGIERIAANCFSSPSIESVELPTTINSIGREAFVGCPNLESIIIKAPNAPTLDGNCFIDSVNIYVGEYYFDSYDESIYFNNISNNVEVLEVNISFYDGNTCIGSKVEEYASMLDNVIIPNKNYYDFIYFTTSDGTIYEKYDDIYFTKNTILYLNYEKSKYQFNLSGYGSVVLEYQAKLNIVNPTKAGYSFEGWYDSTSGGDLVIEIDGNVVWEEASSVTNLYARFELINYYITYDYIGTIDGSLENSFNVENPISLSDLPTIKRFGFVFDGWYISGTNTKFTSTSKIYRDITLVARWLGTYVSYSYSIISNSYAVIDMRYASATSTYNFTISNLTKYVTFIGQSSRTYYMRITINTRSTGLVLGFEDLNFAPVTSRGTGYNAITSYSDFDLYISFKGTCSITGGKGANGSSSITAISQAEKNMSGFSGNKGQNGYNGGVGILAYNVIFQEYDSGSFITVRGGDGGNGAQGQTGQKGSNGVKNPYGSFMSPKKGDNGANGGTGGAGGNGGNGGYAIYVEASTNIKTSSLNTYQFIGGAGGTGGRGGTGGNGGDGASDISSSIWNGVGDAGDGGNGGNGGRGGNGGDGSIATNALYVYGYGGTGGFYGYGGYYGYGGEGGEGGIYGDDGDDGVRGSNGSSGCSGYYGYTGYNQTGSTSSIKTYHYAYDYTNFASIYI